MIGPVLIANRGEIACRVAATCRRLGIRAGPAALAGPTGDFLIGFVPAAALVGWLAARGWTQGAMRSATTFLAGHAASSPAAWPGSAC